MDIIEEVLSRREPFHQVEKLICVLQVSVTNPALQLSREGPNVGVNHYLFHDLCWFGSNPFLAR